MASTIRFVPIGGLATLIAFAIGCGKSDEDRNLVIVRGKIVDNGKPINIDPSKQSLPKGATSAPPGTENGGLRIVFMPTVGDEQFPATYNQESGEFEVAGPKKKGIAPGEYKVVISAGLVAGRKGGNSDDYFEGKFSKTKTPLRVSVKAGEEVNLDIAKAPASPAKTGGK